MTGIGIIGSGAIASVHVESYERYAAECEVKAVCDTFKAKAEDLIAGKALNAAAYDDYKKLLSDPAVEAVSICLPPSTHASVTIDALKAGKHVLVEKPMASSLEECDLMIEAARASGKVLAVVSQNRYKTPVAKLKTMLDEGAIGKVVYASFDSLWWRGQVYYDLWWRGTWAQESGGSFMSHAVHYLDLMHMIFGMPATVSATITNINHDNSECEDLGFVVFNYGDKIVHFTSSLVSHGERQSITVEGEKGSIGVPWTVSACSPLPNGFPKENEEAKAALEHRYREIPDLPAEGHDAQIANFLRAIEGKEPPAVDGLEGRRTMELIVAIYKSSTMGGPVSLPIASTDAFYRKETMIASMPKFHEKKKSVDNFSESKITLGRDLGR
ncbi:MAG: oxidoreductase [Spirochaetae bacterium HGW-Spirochaetae-9]|nr:MAG: oxidoreductase [Spirochaetae bacterium HGW-Spirochaetae-9]